MLPGQRLYLEDKGIKYTEEDLPEKLVSASAGFLPACLICILHLQGEVAHYL